MLNLKTAKKYRSSGHEQVKHLQSLHTKWIEAEQPSRDRMFAALKAYFDIAGGSWPEDSLAEMNRQNRHPSSVPIAPQKINTLAGSILSEKLDFDFMTQELEKSHLIRNIKPLYYYDKEQNDYQFSARKTCIRGLIHLGIEEIGVRYDIRPTGSIFFEPRLPGYVHLDPYWRSDRLKDLKRAMKDAWMTADEILEHFQINNPDLERWASLDAIGGEDYRRIENVDDYKDTPTRDGSKFLVVEYRWLEQIRTTRLYMTIPGGDIIPLPLNAKEEDVRKFMSMFMVESAEEVNEYPYEDQVLKYSVICPDGSTEPIVEEEVHPIQCGYIGYFPFSSCREMGIHKGVMEAYLDIQRTINYREAKKDDIIASAGVGAMIVDKNKIGTNPSKMMKEIAENKTRPDYVCGIDGSPEGAFGLFPSGNVPGDVWRDILQLIDYLDRVGPVTPALEGASEKGESGVLFQMRHAVTKLGTLVFYDNWLQHEEDKCEAWYNQAQITYKGIYMKVPNTNGPGEIELNTPIGNGMYGNAIDMLPRAKIIATLSKESPTEQMSKRAMYYDMAKMLSANPEASLPQFRRVINKMIETIELTPEERRNFKVISDIQEQNDIIRLLSERETMIAQMMQGKVQSEQAKAMLQQMNQQLMQAMGGQQPQQPEEPYVGEETQLPEQEPALQERPGGSVETMRGDFAP